MASSVLNEEKKMPQLFGDNDTMILTEDFKELIRNNSVTGKPTTFDDLM